MSDTLYAVILVYSTSHAIKIEKTLQKAGLTCKLIPVPRHLSSDCGVCVRIRQVDKETTVQALATVRVEIDGIHDI
jgi:hypothetical protein